MAFRLPRIERVFAISVESQKVVVGYFDSAFVVRDLGTEGDHEVALRRPDGA
jgi:hypothetical protein